MFRLPAYATISVPIDVKRCLQKAKGKKEWGEFLLELYSETQQLKSRKAFHELIELTTEEDLKTIAEESKDFREKFIFR